MGVQPWLQGMYLKKNEGLYAAQFHTVLLQEARKNSDNIHKGYVDSGLLTEKDIYPKAWEENKPNKQA